MPSHFVTADRPNGMVHSLFVTVCAYGLLALSLITALSEHRVPSITALASNQCTIPFGRKWHSGKRKCRQQPARQVLACNSRDAKRNPLPARAGSLFEPTAFPQLVVYRYFLPSRAGDSVWPASSSFYRQRGDIRQCRRPSSPQSGQTEWCALPDGGRGKDGRRGE